MLPGRTTAPLVKGIIEVDSIAWPDITPFIDVANELVTEVCAVITKNADGSGGPYYSDYRLEMIERWLAAHFYAIADQQVLQESVTHLSETFQAKIDIGFKQTKQGQQAMRLDTKGALATLDNRANTMKNRRVDIIYLGKTCLPIHHHDRDDCCDGVNH